MPITTPVLSYLQNSEKILPMLLIEAPTTGGRVYQGYKRGGKTEAREKICEESLGAVVWLFGAKAFNKIGDFIGEKVLGLTDLDIDVGKDSLRNPFENVTNKKGLTAAFKFTKIASSAILATLAMGMVVPKIKMAMTNAFRMQAGLEPYPDKKSKDGKFHPTWADKLVAHFIKYDKNNIGKNSSRLTEENRQLPTMDEFLAQSKDKSSLSFTGGGLMNGLLYASHNLENNTTWRLLSTDVGTLTGRVANSRNKKEGIEYFVRDSISSLFYVFAAPISSNLIRKATNTPDIHPKGAEAVRDRLIELLGADKKPVSNEFFSQNFLSKEAGEDLIKGITFKPNGTITLDDFNSQTGGIYSAKAQLMSMLQPQLFDENGVKTSILSQKQVIDVMSDSSMSEPKFLKKAIADVTGGKSDSERAFVSRGKLEGIRDSFDDFVLDLQKYAKKNSQNGLIDEDMINKYTKHLNRKNLLIHMAGIGVAVLGLAYAIPKFQYWVSEKITGEKDFPGEIQVKNQNSDK